MQIIRDLRHIPNLSLALGFFDGLHLGHQAVIGNAVEFAKENNSKSAVITFAQHPFCYLHGVTVPKYILTPEQKYEYMNYLGIDYAIELDFEQIKSLEADEYLKNILIEYFSPIGITTGYSHHFGANKSGNVKTLKEFQQKYNYKYFEIQPQTIDNNTISSTAIRKLITNGNIKSANNMLGKKFQVKGIIIKGRQNGRKIGFPTANIVYPDTLISPPFGVYDVNVKLQDNSIHKGISNYGICPTITNEGTTSFETHILDFDEDIYGQEITLEFNNMIRTEQKFDNIEQLKTQIELDIKNLQ